jgi:3-hydroxyisobutyrate dehydrogenase
MPVSSPKVAAEQGTLVGMLAGERSATETVGPLLQPITDMAISMGLKTTYAVNAFLITITVGLAESMHLARKQGLDIDIFARIFDASPLASTYSKFKSVKMITKQWSPQAAITDYYNLTRLVVDASRKANATIPLVELSSTLYRVAIEVGLGGKGEK